MSKKEFPDILGMRFFGSDPQQKIEAIRRGIPADRVGHLAARMGIEDDYLLSNLGLSRARSLRGRRLLS